MKSRQENLRWTLLLAVLAMLLALVAGCSPAMAPTAAPAEEEPAMPTEAPAAAPEEPAEATRPLPTQTLLPAPTAPAPPQPTKEAVVEGRTVELEWPERMRLGDSDVVRLSLVPTREGYVARAEFPDHTVDSQPVPVPRPNGYELFAVARLDGVGFDIAPGGEQERFVPEGEEVAWRWTLAPRRAGQQRLSVQVHLRWVPAPGVSGSTRETQVFSRGIHIQVISFLGMNPTQAASTGVLGLLAGSGFLLGAAAGTARGAARAKRAARQSLQVTRPNPNTAIEAPPGLALTEEESGLLRGLFSSYTRLVIENEFLSGYSGARTFLARPIRADGCADAPTIVKLGPREDIRREYENYETFVKDRLPPVTARIQRSPVILSSGSTDRSTKGRPARAAVQYTFIAEPGRPPISLRQALLQNPDPAPLLRMFETFGPNWWMQRHPSTFRLGLQYDRLLPPHYVIEPAARGSRVAAGPALNENLSPVGLNLQAGDLVLLHPFQQAELRADGRSYTLTGKAAGGHPGLRVRWTALPLPKQPAVGRITATRMDLFLEWTAGFARFGLPDPLAALPHLLDETVAGTRSVIHGDLNLENVLAGPGGLIWLIDFAQTQEGHPLFDFAHLESELIAHVLAPRCGSVQTYLELWSSGRDPLVSALHQIAGRCLFDPARPREYWLALYMACLGALKYQNLDRLAKYCLYLTAADLTARLSQHGSVEIK